MTFLKQWDVYSYADYEEAVLATGNHRSAPSGSAQNMATIARPMFDAGGWHESSGTITT